MKLVKLVKTVKLVKLLNLAIKVTAVILLMIMTQRTCCETVTEWGKNIPSPDLLWCMVTCWS